MRCFRAQTLEAPLKAPNVRQRGPDHELRLARPNVLRTSPDELGQRQADRDADTSFGRFVTPLRQIWPWLRQRRGSHHAPTNSQPIRLGKYSLLNQERPLHAVQRFAGSVDDRILQRVKSQGHPPKRQPLAQTCLPTPASSDLLRRRRKKYQPGPCCQPCAAPHGFPPLPQPRSKRLLHSTS